MSDEKNSLSQYLPYAGAVLIFLGVVRLSFYYFWFGIKILSYLEFSEILTSFLDKVLLLTFLLIFSIIYLSIRPKEQNTQKLEAIFSAGSSNKGTLWGRICGYIKGDPNYYISIATASFVIASLYWQSLKFYSIIFGIFFFVAICAIVLLNSEMIYHQQSKLRGVPSFFYPGAISFFLFAIVFTLYITFIDIESVKFRKVNKGVVVQLDSLVLKSTPSYYYIGKTNNFLFYYNDSLDKAEVYPMDRVLKIETDMNTVN